MDSSRQPFCRESPSSSPPPARTAQIANKKIKRREAVQRVNFILSQRISALFRASRRTARVTRPTLHVTEQILLISTLLLFISLHPDTDNRLEFYGRSFSLFVEWDRVFTVHISFLLTIFIR